jgi:phage gp36-like protein
MSYTTLDNLKSTEPEAQIIQLTDDANTGAVVTAVANDAMTKADGLIDSYLRGHITLPLPQPYPTIVVQIATELAICNLYVRRFGSNLPDSILTRQKWAEGKLKEIVAGKIVISDDEEVQSASGNVSARTLNRIFTRDILDTFR